MVLIDLYLVYRFKKAKLDVTADALCFTSARELAALIRARKVSAREVMTAFLAQIARLNPGLNAIVARLDDDACLALADRADRALGNGGPIGPLHGLPTAFKDLEPAVGFPQSKGSPIFKDLMPDADSVMVERIRRRGRDPDRQDQRARVRHGLADLQPGLRHHAAIRTIAPRPRAARAAAPRWRWQPGMLPIADGGDLGGSLRNPANFNNVVALRPSVGLVPVAPTPIPFVGVSTKGAMARSVSDVAFGLSVMAGADPRDPQSFAARSAARSPGPLDRDLRGVRVAWSSRSRRPAARSAACGGCSTRNGRPSRSSAASSRRRARISATSTRSS